MWERVFYLIPLISDMQLIAEISACFEENMTICVESYIGEVGGKEGIKLEDQFLVTKDGLKQLSSFPYEYSN